MFVFRSPYLDWGGIHDEDVDQGGDPVVPEIKEPGNQNMKSPWDDYGFDKYHNAKSNFELRTHVSMKLTISRHPKWVSPSTIPINL